jgi:hypothetical protein
LDGIEETNAVQMLDASVKLIKISVLPITKCKCKYFCFSYNNNNNNNGNNESN